MVCACGVRPRDKPGGTKQLYEVEPLRPERRRRCHTHGVTPQKPLRADGPVILDRRTRSRVPEELGDGLKRESPRESRPACVPVPPSAASVPSVIDSAVGPRRLSPGSRIFVSSGHRRGVQSKRTGSDVSRSATGGVDAPEAGRVSRGRRDAPVRQTAPGAGPECSTSILSSPPRVFSGFRSGGTLRSSGTSSRRRGPASATGGRRIGRSSLRAGPRPCVCPPSSPGVASRISPPGSSAASGRRPR